MKGANERDEREDEVLERRFDWALREVTGRERAPDVTAVVLARAATGETGEDPAARWLPRARWLAFAAVFLLGVLTVLGVALLRHAPLRSDASVDEAQQPSAGKLLEVASAAAIPSLPVDLKTVELRNQDDAAVTALAARCPALEHLRIYASVAGRRADDAPAVSITDAAFPAIGSLAKLHTLELLAVQSVEGARMRELERLPLLEHLRLSYFDLGGDQLQFLPRLPSLRRLTMELNMRLDTAGLAAIGACAGLRDLSLCGSHGAPPEAWRPLGHLQGLRTLDLSSIGAVHRGIADEATRQRFPQSIPVNPPENRIAGAALQDWPALTTLRLGASLMAPDIGKQLRARYPRLRELDLEDCVDVDDTTIAHLVGMPSLRVLRIRGCEKVGEPSIALLAASQQLRTIDFGTVSWGGHVNSPWLTLSQVETLLRSGKRVEWYPPEDRRYAFAALCRLHRQLFDRSEQVRSIQEIEALPDDVTRIACRDLGDAAAALLSKRSNLVALELINDSAADRLTGAGLAALRQLPKLASLELMNLRELRPEDLGELGRLRSLRTLRCVNIALDDKALAELPNAEQLEELSLAAIPSFGAAGVAAIARCAGLRKLELAKATQLDAEALSTLGALRGLTELDLSGNPGLRDRALMALRHCTALRRLNGADGAFTSMGLQALGEMRALEVLDLSGNAELVPSALLHVPVSVQELAIDRCRGMDANAAALVRDRFPKLRELRVADNDWVTDDVLRVLVAAPSLQRLHVSRCKSLTDASFVTIRDARNLRFVDVNGTGCISKEQHVQLMGERPELEVVRFVW